MSGPVIHPASRPRKLLGSAVVLTLLLGTAVSAMAARAAAPGNRSLAVSVPAEPVVLAPGKTSTIRIRVLNPGTKAVTVRISGRHVDLGDNGSVSVGTTTDPLWDGRVQFPGRALTIQAQAFVNVDLTVRMPEKLDPDLYFVGFLVSPVVTPNGQVQVVNEIGSFFTIDVPGPRVRRLKADLTIRRGVFAHISIPGVVIGSRAGGTLHIQNIGTTQVRFWGEVDSSSSPVGGSAGQDRIDKSLIPRGHMRAFGVVGKPAWPIDFVTITARVFYPGNTETSTVEIDLKRRVLVISPWVILVAIIALLAGTFFFIRRRRRRRPSPGKATRKKMPERISGTVT